MTEPNDRMQFAQTTTTTKSTKELLVSWNIHEPNNWMKNNQRNAWPMFCALIIRCFSFYCSLLDPSCLFFFLRFVLPFIYAQFTITNITIDTHSCERWKIQNLVFVLLSTALPNDNFDLSKDLGKRCGMSLWPICFHHHEQNRFIQNRIINFHLAVP